MNTIRNPIEWSADQLSSLSRHLGAVGRTLRGGEVVVLPRVNRIEIEDIRWALSRGLDDFWACRSYVVFLCLLYPTIGLLVTAAAFDYRLVPLVFPALSGFALIGPVAAVGLYEISRQRERGEPTGWASAFGVLASPSFGSIFVLALALGVVFLIWLATAQGIYNLTLGPEPPAGLGALISDALTTGAGWAMILIGCGVGFLFAVVVLAVSAVSFPLLLDRDVGLAVAVMTSVAVTMANPRTMAAWGLTVVGVLFLGALPMLFGLMAALPLLGHATWHLYRRAVTLP